MKRVFYWLAILVIIRSQKGNAGDITLTAKSDGLTSSNTLITSSN